jgi:hypothetical protein
MRREYERFSREVLELREERQQEWNHKRDVLMDMIQQAQKKG